MKTMNYFNESHELHELTLNIIRENSCNLWQELVR